MTIKRLRQVFHDHNGTNLLLTCDDGCCLVEFATTLPAPAMRLELLLQPGDRRGLPDRPPVGRGHCHSDYGFAIAACCHGVDPGLAAPATPPPEQADPSERVELTVR